MLPAPDHDPFSESKGPAAAAIVTAEAEIMTIPAAARAGFQKRADLIINSSGWQSPHYVGRA